MTEFKIAPSILSTNFAHLNKKVINILTSKTNIIHFDIINNHYIPNLTINPLIYKTLHKHSITTEINIHLIIKPINHIIPDFTKTNASYITFHPKTSDHIDHSLQLIKAENYKTNLIFNPTTPLTLTKHILNKIDHILLISINPNFNNQKFIPHTLEKLHQAHKMINKSNYDINLKINNNVNIQNIHEITKTNAHTFVTDSAIFNTTNTNDPNQYKTIIAALRTELAKAQI